MKTILLVEDVEEDFILLQRSFMKAKVPAELKWRRDGVEASQWLTEVVLKRPSIAPLFILSDLKMPRMNGFELLQWIRAQPLLRRIPVVVLTSSGASIDINKAYDLGASGYLVKPQAFDQLNETSEALHRYWISANKHPDLS